MGACGDVSRPALRTNPLSGHAPLVAAATALYERGGYADALEKFGQAL